MTCNGHRSAIHRRVHAASDYEAWNRAERKAGRIPDQYRKPPKPKLPSAERKVEQSDWMSRAPSRRTMGAAPQR